MSEIMRTVYRHFTNLSRSLPYFCLLQIPSGGKSNHTSWGYSRRVRTGVICPVPMFLYGKWWAAEAKSICQRKVKFMCFRMSYSRYESGNCNNKRLTVPSLFLYSVWGAIRRFAFKWHQWKKKTQTKPLAWILR